MVPSASIRYSWAEPTPTQPHSSRWTLGCPLLAADGQRPASHVYLCSCQPAPIFLSLSKKMVCFWIRPDFLNLSKYCWIVRLTSSFSAAPGAEYQEVLDLGGLKTEHAVANAFRIWAGDVNEQNLLGVKRRQMVTD